MDQLTLSSLFFLAIIALLTYLASQTFYRIYLHPLSRFPGPKLAAATFLYEAYWDICVPPGGQFSYHLDTLHGIYGPIVRVSPEEIHVKDSQWFDVLFTGPGKVRDRWARSIRANGAPGALGSAAKHDFHRRRRAPLNPFFSKKVVGDLEGRSIMDKVNKLTANLEIFAGTGRIVNLGAACTALTMDVITEYCYGACQNSLSEENFAPRWKKLMGDLFEGVPVSKSFPIILETMSRLPPWLVAKINPDMAPMFEARRMIEVQARKIWRNWKEGKEEGGKTIFHGILQSSLPDEEKALERMMDEAFVIIVAGAETTARVLTVIFAFLIQDRELSKRLRKELSGVMANGLPPSHVLEDIPLVKAVVQEGLRVAAPVTNRPMLIAPNEELIYGEWVIPRGTPTSMTTRNVLFDPEIFPEPEKFDPDRWIRAAEQGQRLDRFLVTFLKGTRSCLGMNLATAEIYLTLAALVSQFDMELYDFDYKRDLEIARDTFVGLPSKESRGVRVKVSRAS